MDITHRSEEFSNNSRKIYLSDSSLRNINGSSLQPYSLSTLENQNHQHFETYQTKRNSAKKDRLPNFSKFTSKESENQLDIDLGSNANERFSKGLSGSLVAHKVIDLRSTNPESNFYTNSSSDNLNKSSYITQMYFGTENSSVVATQTGATAHMSCVVHHIGDCVVSWIRKKDYHLLTVGLTAYSSDERFSATHLKHSEDWTLQIKFVQERDSGIYECQVSTYPPKSIFLHLLVVEARAEISGPNVRYLTPGSTLRLQCHVVQNTESSEFIFWYHDNRMINYDVDRGINVSTDSDFQSSELLITRTRREHSGNYTCVASNTQSASVLIHIFKGDNPAAMYHGDVGSSTKSYQTQLLHILITVATKIYVSIVNRI